MTKATFTGRETGLLAVLAVLIVVALTGCSNATDREDSKLQADMAWAKAECAKTPGCERWEDPTPTVDER